MAKGKLTDKRIYFGKDIQDVMDMPDLVDIQTSSYERFLQGKKSETVKNRLCRGWKRFSARPFPLRTIPKTKQ